MAEYDSPQFALRAGVERAGGQSAFARMVGCTQGNIWLLLKHNRPLPGKYCIAAEQGTGISRSDYNPEIYPREELGPSTHFEAAR